MKLARLQIGTIYLVFLTIGAGCANIPANKELALTEADADWLEMRFGVARMMDRNGKTVAARRGFLEILQRYPDHADSLHRMGVTAVRLDRLAEALDYFQQAAAVKTPSSELLGDWGYTQYLAGELDAAELTLSKAMQLDPNNQRIVNNLAIVLGQQNKLRESLNQFRRVNDEAEALTSFAYVLTQNTDFAGAKNAYHRALEISPTLKIAANGLLQLHQKMPETDRELPRPTAPENRNPERIASAAPGRKTPIAMRDDNVLNTDLNQQVDAVSARPLHDEPLKPSALIADNRSTNSPRMNPKTKTAENVPKTDDLGVSSESFATINSASAEEQTLQIPRDNSPPISKIGTDVANPVEQVPALQVQFLEPRTSETNVRHADIDVEPATSGPNRNEQHRAKNRAVQPATAFATDSVLTYPISSLPKLSESKIVQNVFGPNVLKPLDDSGADGESSSRETKQSSADPGKLRKTRIPIIDGNPPPIVDLPELIVELPGLPDLPMSVNPAELRKSAIPIRDQSDKDSKSSGK